MSKLKQHGVLFIIFISISLSSFGQTGIYDVKILNPNIDGINVGRTFNVTGKATIPSGGYLWVLVHRLEGFKYVWYPQGDGEIDPTTKSWNVSVNFGNKCDIGYVFEIAVIIVDSREHARLGDYIATAMTSGDWKPIKMPATLTAPTYRRVKKTSDD